MTQLPAHRVVPFVIVAYIILFLQIATFHGHYHDDAFITFRYGANLASGKGMVFNENERIMGSTSLGQTLLCALLFPVVGHDNLPDVMIAMGCIGWLLQAVAVFFLLRQPVSDVPAGFVALCVAAGAAGSHSWTSLETNSAVALVLFAMLAATRSRWPLAAVLSAVAVVMRPDAFLPASCLAVLCAVEKKKEAAKPVAIFLLCIAPWVIFSIGYFGTPLPQSAVAKFQKMSLSAYGLHLITYPPKVIVPFIPSNVFTTIGVWLIAALGSALLARNHKSLWLLPAYAVLHFAAYLYLRPYAAHVWHLYPGTAVLTVLCLTPLAMLYPAARHHRIARTALLALMALFVIGYGWRTVSQSRGYASSYWGGARHKSYEAAVAYLKTHAKPTDTVAAVEVGTIGYLSGLRMHDLGNLVTKRPTLNSADYDWLILDGLYVNRAPPHARLAAVVGSGEFKAYIFSSGSDGQRRNRFDKLSGNHVL